MQMHAYSSHSTIIIYWTIFNEVLPQVNAECLYCSFNLFRAQKKFTLWIGASRFQKTFALNLIIKMHKYFDSICQQWIISLIIKDARSVIMITYTLHIYIASTYALWSIAENCQMNIFFHILVTIVPHTSYFF